MIERRALAAGLAVVALTCGGCFGDAEEPAPAPAGEVSVGTPMTIYEPKADQRLKAATPLADSLRSTVTVRAARRPCAPRSTAGGRHTSR